MAAGCFPLAEGQEAHGVPILQAVEERAAPPAAQEALVHHEIMAPVMAAAEAAVLGMAGLAGAPAAGGEVAAEATRAPRSAATAVRAPEAR